MVPVQLPALFWFETVVQTTKAEETKTEEWWAKLRSHGLLANEVDLMRSGRLNKEEEFRGIIRLVRGGRISLKAREGDIHTIHQQIPALQAFRLNDFSRYLRSGGLGVSEIFNNPPAFEEVHKAGKCHCLSVIMQNLPSIDISQTNVDDLISFVKDEETIQMRRRLFHWQNEMDRRVTSPRELQELIETRIDDYTTWIKAARLTLAPVTLESIVRATAEVVENLVRLKPSKALDAIVRFRHRRVKLASSELKAPARELAFIYHARKKFGEKESSEFNSPGKEVPLLYHIQKKIGEKGSE
jgi:hypothetical protein